MSAGRVTVVLSSLGAGGAERAAVEVAAGLVSRGWQVDLLTVRCDVSDFHATPAGVCRSRADAAAARDTPWWNVFAQAHRSRALRRSILNLRPDVVLSFTDLTNVAVLQALLGSDLPVVVSEQIDPRMMPLGRRWESLRRALYPRARTVLVQSTDVQAWAGRARRRWRVRVAANPVAALPELAAAAPAWFGPRNLVAMGRLAPQKGFDLLLPVFAALSREFPHWHLTILGEGPERGALTAQAEALGVADRVHLPGLVNPPWGVLAAGDLFVFPSRFEGFPNALMEAMACGLPAVSFDCPTGPRDIVRPDVDGVLVPALDVAGLQRALSELMRDERRRKGLADRAADVRERFGRDRVVQVWHQVLRDALAGTAGSDRLQLAEREQHHP